MTLSRHLVTTILVTAGAASALIAQGFRPPTVPRPAPAGFQTFTVGADEAGCKDSALLPRIAGCSILQCDADPATTSELIVGMDAEGGSSKDEISGAAETLYYLCPAKVTHASIVATAEAKFVKDGYRIVARSKEGEEEPLITAVKEGQWIQITTYTYESSSAYVQTTMLADPEQGIDAATVEQELANTGRVALTGLRFDKDQVSLPVSADQLFTELAALLSKKPDWKIRIEANCDEAADPVACMTLGEKRAEAVAGTLVAKGVEKGRVVASPITASVPHDEDRTKPHIQLVKY